MVPQSAMPNSGSCYLWAHLLEDQEHSQVTRHIEVLKTYSAADSLLHYWSLYDVLKLNPALPTMSYILYIPC